MPSYTDEQKRRAVDMVEEFGGSAARAMRRLGYPTRQTLYHWLNRRDAPHERCLCQAGNEQSGTRNLSSLADGLVKRSPFRASAPHPCGGSIPRTR